MRDVSCERELMRATCNNHSQLTTHNSARASQSALPQARCQRMLPTMTARLRWGILGTGNIACQFAAGLNASRRGRLVAIGSRNRETAEVFARRFSVPCAYGSYEELLADPAIDVVYNSLPNSLHHPWTVAALRAGKHVLCEKPLAMDAAEAEEMFDVARSSGRLLMEAFMYRCHPQTLAVLEAVRKGVIGELRLLRTSFCFNLNRTAGNVRLVRELGGGALMDIGCYCVNFSRALAGAEPAQVQAAAHRNAASVDDLVAGSMVFPSGMVASFTCGINVQADNTAWLYGTEGSIEIPVPWKPLPGQARYIVRRPDATVEICRQESGEQYGNEADAFAASVLDGRSLPVSPEDSLGNMRVLDEMRRQIGLQWINRVIS